jgi:hypothetical protein
MAYCTHVKDERSKTQEEVAAALVTVFKISSSLPRLFRIICEYVVEHCANSEEVLAQVCHSFLSLSLVQKKKKKKS